MAAYQSTEKIKKVCTDMKETALRPIRMNLGIYRNGNYKGKNISLPTIYS